MSRRDRQYWIVEHIWRLLRILPMLIGTALWLYTSINPHIIFGLFILSGVVDQSHGKICRFIERVLRFKCQHNDWE